MFANYVNVSKNSPSSIIAFDKRIVANIKAGIMHRIQRSQHQIMLWTSYYSELIVLTAMNVMTTKTVLSLNRIFETGEKLPWRIERK